MRGFLSCSLLQVPPRLLPHLGVFVLTDHSRMVTEEEQFDLWTTGPIIDAVSELQLYPDSKTYV